MLRRSCSFFTGELARGHTGNRRIRPKPVVPRELDLPFQHEPRRDVFVAGTVDHFSGCKSAFFPDRKPSRRHNLVLIQDRKRLVRAGGDRWHLAAIR
jgi:hypothetical protein